MDNTYIPMKLILDYLWVNPNEFPKLSKIDPNLDIFDSSAVTQVTTF